MQGIDGVPTPALSICSKLGFKLRPCAGAELLGELRKERIEVAGLRRTDGMSNLSCLPPCAQRRLLRLQLPECTPLVAETKQLTKAVAN